MIFVLTGTEMNLSKRSSATGEIRPFHLEGLCGSYTLNPAQARDWRTPGP